MTQEELQHINKLIVAIEKPNSMNITEEVVVSYTVTGFVWSSKSRMYFTRQRMAMRFTLSMMRRGCKTLRRVRSTTFVVRTRSAGVLALSIETPTVCRYADPRIMMRSACD